MLSFASGGDLACRRRSIFFYHCDDYFHPFFDFIDLRRHFLDQVMLDPGKLFNAVTLFARLIQQRILFDGKPAHPPKTDAPTNGARHSHPKCQSVFTHKRFQQSTGAPPARGNRRNVIEMMNIPLNLMIQSIHRQFSEQNGV